MTTRRGREENDGVEECDRQAGEAQEGVDWKGGMSVRLMWRSRVNGEREKSKREGRRGGRRVWRRMEVVRVRISSEPHCLVSLNIWTQC